MQNYTSRGDGIIRRWDILATNPSASDADLSLPYLEPLTVNRVDSSPPYVAYVTFSMPMGSGAMLIAQPASVGSVKPPSVANATSLTQEIATTLGFNYIMPAC
jgi:hypothetical protein